jgi:hypothetical protein
MSGLRRVCVFCGSSTGQDPRYAEAAAAMGRALVAADLELVYGGGAVGLMGIVADDDPVRLLGTLLSAAPSGQAPRIDPAQI